MATKKRSIYKIKEENGVYTIIGRAQKPLTTPHGTVFQTPYKEIFFYIRGILSPDRYLTMEIFINFEKHSICNLSTQHEFNPSIDSRR